MKRFVSFFPLPALLLILNTSNYAQSGLNLLWEKSVDVRTIQFTPDGNLLVTGGRSNLCNLYKCGQIKTWNVADSSLLYTIEAWQFGLTNDIDISSDGERFISGNGSVYCSAFSGCVIDRPGQYEFNINGSPLYSNTDPGGNIYSIAYSPNESIIAAGTGYNNTGEIRIYDSSYNLLHILWGHSSSTTDVVFTPDGQYLLSGGYDGYIRKWNYLDGTISNYWQHGTLFNGGIELNLSVSPDGQYLASTGEGYNLSTKIWKISDGTLVHSFNNDNEYSGSSFVEFTPNGLYIAVGLTLPDPNSAYNIGIIRFYELSSGNLVREYNDSTGQPHYRGVRTLAFSIEANDYFAYSAGFASSSKLRVVSTDLNLTLSPTPVELTSFSADVNSNNVILNWVTASEQNNRGFEIQRLYSDGNNKLNSWEKIGLVEGKGTSAELNYYSYEDKNLLQGEYQYRLKQIDFDGSFEYSDIVEVDVITPAVFSLSQNYPNPFNPTTNIEYQIPEDGFVSLTVYNAIGQTIKQLVNKHQAAGNYSVNFDSGSAGSEMPSGLYFYSLQSGEFNVTRKMILLK